jgi:hypothetical protein
VIRGFAAVAVAACALAVAGEALAAGAAVAERSSAPRAQLREFVCQRARVAAQREISVQALIRPVTGTVKMALRFQLLARTRRNGPLKALAGRNLGSWVTPSNPTLGQNPADVWIVNHPVLDLSAPATYRFRVTFRWTGPGGVVLQKIVQSSGDCFQPQLGPELIVRSLAVSAIAGAPGEDRYDARIANFGASAAGPFDVQFAPGGGGVVQTAHVSALAAHASVWEQFIGPPCTSATAPTITVDPAHQVSEDTDPAGSLMATCPLS